jgi:hypothetical protein
VVRSAVDANHRNRRVSFKSDVQESLKLLGTKPSFVWKDSHHNHVANLIIQDISINPDSERTGDLGENLRNTKTRLFV